MSFDTNDVFSSQVIGTFNMLADGLSFGEFLCGGSKGDDGTTLWYPSSKCSVGRGLRIVNTIVEMFTKGVTILNTQENDHAEWILKQIQYNLPYISMVKILKYDKPGKSNAIRFLKKNLIDKSEEVRSLYKEYGIDDDCLAIYYDSRVVTPMSVNQIFLSEKKGVATLAGIVKFKCNETGIVFNDVNAHLK